MRVKFTMDGATSISKTMVKEIDCLYIEDDSNLIYLLARNNDVYSFQSTKPLNYFDVDSFEKWSDQLLVNGYVDLTNTGYEFEADEDDSEEDQLTDLFMRITKDGKNNEQNKNHGIRT